MNNALNIATASLLFIALNTSADEAPDFFVQLSVQEASINFGVDSDGFGHTSSIGRAPNEGDVPATRRQYLYQISGGQQDRYWRAYGSYSLAPNNTRSVWTLSANMDATTDKSAFIGAFIGAGLGIAGTSWSTRSEKEKGVKNSIGFAVPLRAGIFIKPLPKWSIEMGYQYNKTHLEIPTSNKPDNPETPDVNESDPSFFLTSIEGFYASLNMAF